MGGNQSFAIGHFCYDLRGPKLEYEMKFLLFKVDQRAQVFHLLLGFMIFTNITSVNLRKKEPILL